MKPRFAGLCDAVRAELEQRQKDGILYEIRGDERNEHVKHMKALEFCPDAAKIQPQVIFVFPGAFSKVNAMRARAPAAAQQILENCVNSAISSGNIEQMSNNLSLPSSSAHDLSAPQATPAADAVAAGEAESDVTAAKLRMASDGEIQDIIREQGLNNMKRIRPIRELRAGLQQDMSKRDQETFERIPATLVSRIVNKKSNNKKTKEEKNVTINFWVSFYHAWLKVKAS